MKKYILYIASIALASGLLSSCMQDALPQDNGATHEQVMKADKAGLVNGMVQYLNTPYYSSPTSYGIYTQIGYPEHMIWRDIMTSDLPIRDDGYDYWTAYSQCLYMGNWAYQSCYFWYYNKMLYQATSVIKVCDKKSPTDAFALANGYAFRAFTTFEMARMYEFKATGTSLDADYTQKLKGLTIPIINEYSDEALAVNNPRAPYYQLYRYVLNDLNCALDAIERSDTKKSDKNYASIGMIYGQLARFWLELGSRFERHPDDLAEQIAHDKDQWTSLGEDYQNLPAIGITDAKQAFEKAATYARKAISSGYTPLTRSQWYDTATGFNTNTNDSWMWAIIMSSSDYFVVSATWMSWPSFMSPEPQYGISGAYQGQFMIDANLFSVIPDSDWRKRTWIDPNDLPLIIDWQTVDPAVEEKIKEAFDTKYKTLTNLPYDTWKHCRPYVGFKYHPGSGNITTATTANKVDIPLMRVEEMYFIEAEALAHSQGIGAGIDALNSFMNTYRYTDGSYKCTSSSRRAFEVELVRQKRIEFWGEGVTLFDIKRLEMAVIRGYSGSNHPAGAQFNSKDGFVAPWSILYIPVSEGNQNKALVLNPDPSAASQELKY